MTDLNCIDRTDGVNTLRRTSFKSFVSKSFLNPTLVGRLSDTELKCERTQAMKALLSAAVGNETTSADRRLFNNSERHAIGMSSSSEGQGQGVSNEK